MQRGTIGGYDGPDAPWNAPDAEEREGICTVSIPIPMNHRLAQFAEEIHNEWLQHMNSMSYNEFHEWLKGFWEDKYIRHKQNMIEEYIDKMVCKLFGFRYIDDPRIVQEDRCDWKHDLEKALHGTIVDDYFDMEFPSWELKDGAHTYMIIVDCPCTIWGDSIIDYDEDGPYEYDFEIDDDDALDDVSDDIKEVLTMLHADIEVKLKE